MSSLSSSTNTTALIDILLSCGAEISQQDRSGDTILHLMAKFLLRRGTDVSFTNVKGNTALHEYIVMGIILPRQTRNGGP